MLVTYSQQDRKTSIKPLSLGLTLGKGMGETNLELINFSKLHMRKKIMLKIIMQRNQRSAFAKFRMGVAPLRIETGRYERLEEEQRVCFNCGDAIESEEHVLLECPLYQQIREPWFVKLRQHIPDFYVKTKQEKLICIFSCDIIPVIRLSGKICSDILKERRKILYK